MNCDVVSTFILTRNVRWVTKMCLCYTIMTFFPNFRIRVPTLVDDNENTRETLLEIENSTSKVETKNSFWLPPGSAAFSGLRDF